MSKFFRIIAWFHLICVPALISAADISHLSKPSGRVTLYSFERGHLRTVTDAVNAEVVLTMPPRYFEAYLFECNASYPVQWAYIGEAAPVVTADVGRFFKDFYDVQTYTYQSILLMYSLQELQSGRYICRGASKEHDKLAIHYDVFVPGNGTLMLLSTSEKKLFIPETKEHAYIPCGVSDSTSVINLYRGNQWGTFHPVPVNGSIVFNPRKGFKIRFKDFLDPWGTYLCVSASNKRRRKVHLIPESLKAKYEMINHVSGKVPVYFSYEYEYNRVLCCTGTNFLPKLQWAGCGSILDCQVKSACFEEDRCEQRLGNSGYNPTKWIDPGPLPNGCSGYKLRDDPNGDFGLFKCSTPGIAQYQPYLLNRGNIFLDFEKTPPSEMILTLQRISPEGLSYVGDELEFHCNSTRFYFAYGIRWGWEKKNGEIDFVDDSVVVRDKYSVRGHRRRTTFKIPHADIKSIICFVPVVNSATEWRTVSLPVVIKVHDINFIPHQNPAHPPPNNLIDIDNLHYHTDYDTPSPPQLQQFKPIPTSAEQSDRDKDPNYYSYSHDSGESLPQVPSNNIEPLQQPHTIDIFPDSTSYSTPSPVPISRSNKRSRSRSNSFRSKSDNSYEADRDFVYDSFEPRPSSSSSNSRLQSTKGYHREKVNRAPHYSSNRRPHQSHSPSSSYRRNNYRDEAEYKPKKAFRDYNYKEHEIGVDMRLSLPFEPLISTSRGRFPYNNYTTVGPSSRDNLPLRTNSPNGRSNSRRPSPTSQSEHRRAESRNNYRNDKEYSIDDSYSQHVRLSLPENSVTRAPHHQPERKRERSRTYKNDHHDRGQSHSRHSSRDSSHNNHPRNPDYYYTDDSPVEIKVPRTKSHEPYRHSRPSHYQSHQSNQDHQSHQRNQDHQSHQNQKDHYEAEPEYPEAQQSTWRRRPHSIGSPERHSPATVYDPEHVPKSRNDNNNNNHRQSHYQRHQKNSKPELLKPSPRRSYSRGMKFEGSAAERGNDAYETASPTARPVYYVPTTQKYSHDQFSPVTPKIQNSNELIRTADVDLKRLPTPSRPRSTVVPIELRRKTTVKPSNSSDILHSVSISISSRVTHADRDGIGGNIGAHHHDENHPIHPTSLVDGVDNEVTTSAPTTVPIQFFHVKPVDISSFQPARSFIDEDDEDEMG